MIRCTFAIASSSSRSFTCPFCEIRFRSCLAVSAAIGRTCSGLFWSTQRPMIASRYFLELLSQQRQIVQELMVRAYQFVPLFDHVSQPILELRDQILHHGSIFSRDSSGVLEIELY